MEEKKPGFFKCIGLLWKGIFDYKGKSGLREFWFPFLFNAIFVVLATILLVLAAVFEALVLDILAGILLIHPLVSTIPFIALTVRRLRDAGKSGWWMCLIFIVGVGYIALLVLCAGVGTAVNVLNTVDFDPSVNIQEDIYGPPEMFDYDPEYNIEETIYGPPEFFEDENIVYPEEEPEPEEYDPAWNIEEDIYGPPEMFDDYIEEEIIEYEPNLNENICIYGPPEMFDDYELKPLDDRGEGKAREYANDQAGDK